MGNDRTTRKTVSVVNVGQRGLIRDRKNLTPFDSKRFEVEKLG